MQRKEVYEAIDSEREYQIRKWGDNAKHGHEVGAYLTLLRRHLALAEIHWSQSGTDYLALDELRQILAIGVSCAEQHGINFRSPHISVASKRT